MTTCKIIFTPTTKEPKICHALATASALNLKLCHNLSVYTIDYALLLAKTGIFESTLVPKHLHVFATFLFPLAALAL